MVSAGLEQSISYFKRFRMEIDLNELSHPVPDLPVGYFWLPWHRSLLDRESEIQTVKSRTAPTVAPGIGPGP